MTTHQIQITKADHEKLSRLIRDLSPAIGRPPAELQRLQEELDRAELTESVEIDPDTVTLHSSVQIRLLDSKEPMEFTLVCPDRADIETNRLSILAPLGTAVLGSQVGDTFEWSAPAGIRRARVEKIVFQPEQVMRSEAASGS